MDLSFAEVVWGRSADVCPPRLKTQIVIVGGGAAGLELARKLGAALGRGFFDIILLERERTHIWKPVLHEVAAASLRFTAG